MKRLFPLAAFCVVWAGTSVPALADDEGRTSVGGTFYFDAFADFTDRADDDPTPTRGFELRRIYLTVTRSWGDATLRHTTDIDSKFGTGNLNVFSKYAYLEHKGLIDGAKVLVGQHSPKTHGWVDKRWRYRSMANTMSDANKWTHSAQLGIGLQGKGMDGRAEYYLSVNNGNGYKKPVAKDGFGLSARVAAQPSKGVWVSGLVAANAPGGVFDDDTAVNFTEVVALDGFDLYFEGLVGWEGNAASVFAQYGMFTDDQYTNGGLNPEGAFDDRESSGLSIFGRARLVEGTWGVGRFDLIDPNTAADEDGHSTILVGVSRELHEGYFLQPNVTVTTFEGDADSETEARLTFYGTI